MRKSQKQSFSEERERLSQHERFNPFIDEGGASLSFVQIFNLQKIGPRPEIFGMSDQQDIKCQCHRILSI